MIVDQAATTLERQARACANLAADRYADLLLRAAGDVRAGGPCAEVLAGYLDAPADAAVPLRLLGGVHALVLTGRAPELARFYPSAGGRQEPGDADDAWAAFRAVVAAEHDTLRGWLRRPPQTNEVGRANLLVAGLLYALGETGRRPVRLAELGASAGLNLRADRFRIEGPDFAWGSTGSPVRLPDAWRGGAPDWLRAAAEAHPEVTVVERLGCDVTPLDPTSADGALALRAYVWPEHTARAARLAGALELARRLPARVAPVGAADFLAGLDPRPGTLTVVWHSVMRQYVPAEEWARVTGELDRLAATADADAPVAYLFFEPDPVDGRHCQLRARINAGPQRVLAEAHPHGLPAWTP
ncbi:DUF2332 domain-containing protein [Micromonospora sp. WMMD812]|uniref:DUF2332 domain-containing protein n=1 Tax=Micromonospora sp. WMMD812 TaxID=3015152 RepID=UPI00248AFCBE|nr:DUF2332 domain-containing protein [Micromonospora sp. WMMD812]WBB65966.1 DUF2332 domain-containing protein [Micromonospora sp. WMMD812]